MNLNQINKRMNFLIHHYDRSDVTDWIILRHELSRWEKAQTDYFKQVSVLKEEIEYLKREFFELFLNYEPQWVIQELGLNSSDFIKKKKENAWEKEEIEKILKDVLCE